MARGAKTHTDTVPQLLGSLSPVYVGHQAIPTNRLSVATGYLQNCKEYFFSIFLIF